MKLIIGSLSMSLAIFGYCFVLLAAQNPRQPRWASDNWVANVHSIIIIALGLIGFLTYCAVFAAMVSGGGADWVSILVSIGILALTFIGVKAMGIGRKLEQFQREAKIVPFAEKPAALQAADGHGMPDKPNVAA